MGLLQNKQVRTGVKMKSSRRMAVLLLSVQCLAACLCANEWEDVLKKAKKTEEAVDFYGRVLDQEEHPVAGASVLYTISAYGFPRPDYKSGNVQTDVDGKFEIHGGKAAILYIKAIELRGYEFKRGMEKAMFEYYSDYYDRHHPSKDRPVVFHLRRKMLEAVALISYAADVVLEKEKLPESFALDFARRFYGNPQSYPEYYWDIEATGKLNEEKREWTVTFRMNGGNAGMQFLDEFLYEAPAEGYKRELAMTFSFAEGRSGVQQLPKYMYLRLRDPGVYARMLVEKVSVSGNGFKLSFS